MQKVSPACPVVLHPLNLQLLSKGNRSHRLVIIPPLVHTHYSHNQDFMAVLLCKVLFIVKGVL